MMDWLILAFFGAAALVGAFQLGRFIYRTLHPPTKILVAIQTGLRRIQLAAAENVFDKRDGDDPYGLVELAENDRQAATIEGDVRFVYAIVRDDEGFRHVVAALLVDPKADRRRLLWMATATEVLSQQLLNAGIDDEEGIWDLSLFNSQAVSTPPLVRSFSIRLSLQAHEIFLKAESTIPDATASG